MRMRDLLAAALLLCATGAGAQSVGTGDTARHLGLGGGGIALPGPDASPQFNPAALAGSRGVRLPTPRVGLAGKGRKAEDILTNILENQDFDHLLEVGPELLFERHFLWTNLEQSLRFENFEIGFSGGFQLDGTPNQALRRFARKRVIDFPPPQASLQAQFGYHFALPVAYGHRFRLRGEVPGRLDVGLRLIPYFGIYEGATLRARNRRIVLEDRTRNDQFNVGADLGLRFAPEALPNTHFGLVVHGLSEGAVGRMRRPRTVDLGAAWQVNPKTVVTADWLNLPAVGRRRGKFGVGAEYTVWKRIFAVRGAVTTRGLAGGFSVGPVSFAFSRDGEALLGTGFSF